MLPFEGEHPHGKDATRARADGIGRAGVAPPESESHATETIAGCGVLDHLGRLATRARVAEASRLPKRDFPEGLSVPCEGRDAQIQEILATSPIGKHQATILLLGGFFRDPPSLRDRDG